MNRDFRVQIQLAGEDKIQLVLFSEGVFPTVGRKLQPPRAVLALEGNDLGEIFGDEGRVRVDEVTAEVSQWLLQGGLDVVLETMMAGLPDQGKLRLIFSSDSSLRSVNFDPSALPIELARSAPDALPYALDPKVASILHLLDKVGNTPSSTSSLNWPLRVLLVRSNPADLGGAVPEAAPFRDQILALGNALGAGTVQVDVLSREPGVNKPATWNAVTGALYEGADPYDILLYLGHGNLIAEGAYEVGALQLESEDGQGHKDVKGYELVVPLQNRPVPVVVLAACLTAAQVTEAKFQDLYRRKMKDWLRGSQGVAQALINSQSGVQLVVGMRYRLETEDAERFIANFFDGLLRINRGNVEAAVYHARQALKNHSRYPAAFSAPVVFRKLRGAEYDEPVFPFLTTPPPPPRTCQTPPGNWQMRTVFWDDLQSLPWEPRLLHNKDAVLSFLGFLKRFEDEAVKTAVAHAPLVMPEVMPENQLDWLVKKPGETVTLPVRLYGTLNPLDRLRGKLAVDREQAIIQRVQASPQLRGRGYKLLSEIMVRQVEFQVEPSGEGAPQGLQDMVLFEVTMQLGTAFNVRYNFGLSGLEATPPAPVCPGANALIVPP